MSNRIEQFCTLGKILGGLERKVKRLVQCIIYVLHPSQQQLHNHCHYLT